MSDIVTPRKQLKSARAIDVVIKARPAKLTILQNFFLRKSWRMNVLTKLSKQG
jgi:hypothetical protein